MVPGGQVAVFGGLGMDTAGGGYRRRLDGWIIEDCVDAILMIEVGRLVRVAKGTGGECCTGGKEGLIDWTCVIWREGPWENETSGFFGGILLGSIDGGGELRLGRWAVTVRVESALTEEVKAVFKVIWGISPEYSTEGIEALVGEEVATSLVPWIAPSVCKEISEVVMDRERER
jgi:hypothetical protein